MPGPPRSLTGKLARGFAMCGSEVIFGCTAQCTRATMSKPEHLVCIHSPLCLQASLYCSACIPCVYACGVRTFCGVAIKGGFVWPVCGGTCSTTVQGCLQEGLYSSTTMRHEACERCNKEVAAFIFSFSGFSCCVWIQMDMDMLR